MKLPHLTSALLASLALAAPLAACGGGMPQPPTAPGLPGEPTATPKATASAAGTTTPPTASTGGAAASPAPAFTGPMGNLEASKLVGDLEGLGLDPRNLPALDKLDPKVLRKVMSTFTKSLGVQCGGCHAGDNFAAPTPMKNVARKMWNEYVRGHTMNGQPVYCDSCHQGHEKMLNRTDKKALSAWMEANFVKKLDRKDKKEIECGTCHGDPFEGSFLSAWREGK
jgi:hypothetical protein